jgi:hypothetical protein
MRPRNVWRGQVACYRLFVTSGVFHDFAATANALIRLDVRAGRNLLQKHFDLFAALLTFKSEDTGWLVHEYLKSDNKIR